MERLTVAFWQLGAHNWHGGQALVGNAIRSLRATRAEQIRLLVVGDASEASAAYARDVGAHGVVPCEAPPRWSARRLTSALLVRWKDYNSALEAPLRKAGVQVVVGESVSWQLGRIASVGWLWDFQHLHLRDFFDAQEVARRDQTFRRTMRLADRLLATRSVGQDAQHFAPEHAHKLRVIRPHATMDASVYERDPRTVVSKFELPDKFFYVPNQFWVHKNHRALLDALDLLRRRGSRPHIVLTGRAADYRAPQHFHDLMRHAVESKLAGQVHYLGVVDKQDVVDLMRQTICVVNPSLFEGWGYSVDEAAGIGKRILASDIPAHREQAAPACELFDPRCAEELAAKFEHVWDTAEPGPSEELEACARSRMPQRIQTLGAGLFDALHEAVAQREHAA